MEPILTSFAIGMATNASLEAIVHTKLSSDELKKVEAFELLKKEELFVDFNDLLKPHLKEVFDQFEVATDLNNFLLAEETGKEMAKELSRQATIGQWSVESVISNLAIPDGFGLLPELHEFIERLITGVRRTIAHDQVRWNEGISNAINKISKELSEIKDGTSAVLDGQQKLMEQGERAIELLEKIDAKPPTEVNLTQINTETTISVKTTVPEGLLDGLRAEQNQGFEGIREIITKEGKIEYGIPQLKISNESMLKGLDLRYTPEHHVPTGSQEVLAAFCNKAFFVDLVRSTTEALIFEWNRFIESNPLNESLTQSEELESTYGRMNDASNVLLPLFNNGEVQSSIGSVLAACNTFQSEIASVEEQLFIENGKHKRLNKTPQWQGTKFDTIIRAIRKVDEALIDVIKLLNKHKPLDYQYLLVLGEAGSGKSHLLAKQVEELTVKESPVALFLGEQFHGGESLEKQIVDLCQFPGSFQDFLTYLNGAVFPDQSTAIVMIDGINESDDRRMWNRKLSLLADKFIPFPNVKFIVSCRIDFCKLCLPRPVEDGTSDDWGRMWHRGFDDNLFEAVTKYFNGYKVESDHLPPLIPEFKNPLFLKTVCEAYSNTRLEVGELTLKAIMDKRVNVLCEKIEEAIDCSPIETRECLMKLSKSMSSHPTPAITSFDAIRICKEVFSVAEQSKSLYSHLRSNGFLVEFIDVSTETEMVRFPYERFSNYFIVELMLEGVDTAEQFIDWWDNGFKDNFGNWNWRRENRGALGVLAILAPERYQLELNDVIRPKEWDNQSLELFTDSLVWRKSVSPTTQKWLDKVREFDKDQGSTLWLDSLFRLCTIPSHPFNGIYTHNLLLGMTLPEREREWTILLNHKTGDEWDSEDSLTELLEWANCNGELLSDEQSELLGCTLLWVCTTTDRTLRDKATNVANRILKGKSGVATRIVGHFSSCNDSYVNERVYAVASAVATVEKDEKSLRELANIVYCEVFSSEQVNPHILIRHYARSVIEVAFYQGVMEDDAILISSRPPYNSDFPTIIDESEYSSYNDNYDSPYSTIVNSLQPDLKTGYGDFGRYEMQYSIERFSTVSLDVDSTKEELKKCYCALSASRWIFQRILDLGWTPDIFFEYEKRVRSGDRRPPKIERISKKYQWIGFYEFCGYLADHFQMRYDWSEQQPVYDRPSSIGRSGIDPCVSYCENQNGWIDTRKIQDQYPDPFAKEESLVDRKAWVDQASLPSFSPLISGEFMGDQILLSGNFEWKEELPFAQEEKENGRLKMWAHVRSYLVEKDNKQALLEQLRESDLYGNRINLNELSDVTLGEYPWSDGCFEIRELCQGEAGWLRDVNIDLLATTCQYSSGSVFGIVPAPQVCDLMSLQWTGDRFDFATDGVVVFESACDDEQVSPQVAVVDMAALESMLEDSGMDIVWCLVVERSCWNGNSHITGTESEYSYIFYREGGTLQEEMIRHHIEKMK